MRRRQAMRHVVLPQAMRVVIPPLGNEFNNMLKVTSLLSVIGLQELFLAAQDYNSATFRTFEIFLVTAIYYIVMTTVWSLIQSAIERRLQARGGTWSPPSRCGSACSAAAALASAPSSCGVPGDAVAGKTPTPASRARRRPRAHRRKRARWPSRAPGSTSGSGRPTCSTTFRSRSPAARWWCIIGPSGSGKTTLLRCLNHLERIDRGRLLVNGHLIGYRENAKGELSEDPRRRSPASGARSASCSSISTCSRT